MKVEFEKKNLIKPVKTGKVCPECGIENKRTSGFCVYCGQRLDGEKKAVKPCARQVKLGFFSLVLMAILGLMLLIFYRKYGFRFL